MITATENKAVNDTSTQKAVVLFATPLAKDVRIDARTMMYIQNETSGRGWKWATRVGYGAEHSRNEMVLEMLEGDYTHIYFVDADTIPSLGTIDKLLAHDKDIIAGITPIWNTERRWNYQIEEDVPVPAAKPPTEIFTVARTGGTTILIKRGVFEKLEWPYFKTEKRGDVYQTDDYYFCDKARAAGFDIWIDPTIVCDHWNYVSLLQLFFKDFDPK
jgi:hypothetical protein